jgi:hypothetical protein
MELELLHLRDPERAQAEIVEAFSAAGSRALTAEEAGFIVEAHLRAMTETELDMLLTIEQRERLRVIAQIQITGTEAPEESLLNPPPN